MTLRELADALRHVESWAPFCACKHPAPTPLGMCLGCMRAVRSPELLSAVADHKARKAER